MIERRYIKKAELRTEKKEGEPAKLMGYAALFDTLSEPLWGFREKIAPEAFSRAIAEKQDVRALWNHNPDYVLGRTKNGTLALSVDSRGLFMVAVPPETQWARDLIISIERGDIDQQSFGFSVFGETGDKIEEIDGEIIRTLLDVDLYDVSPVTFPAYTDTSVEARSIIDRAKKQGLAQERGVRMLAQTKLKINENIRRMT